MSGGSTDPAATLGVARSSGLSWVVGAAVGGAALLACLAAGLGHAVSGLLAAGVMLAGVAAWIDIRTLRLPNELCAAVFAAGVLAGVFDSAWRASLIGAIVAAVPFGVVHVVGQRSLGFGDVKYAGALGALVGVVWWPSVLVMGSVAFFAMAAVRLRIRSGPVPAGPSVLVGGLCGLGLALVLRARGVL